jgi:hypothetical protein
MVKEKTEEAEDTHTENRGCNTDKKHSTLRTSPCSGLKNNQSRFGLEWLGFKLERFPVAFAHMKGIILRGTSNSVIKFGKN